jgi:hypothetical protein
MMSVISRTNPGLVLAVDSTEPRALPLLIDLHIFGARPRKPTPAERAQLQDALRQWPLSSRILRQIAMSYDFEARTPKSGELLALADRVSRRDLLTEVLSSEVAARKADAPGAMRHLNAALSTSRRASTVIFPLLTKALADPTLRPVMAQYLTQSWGDDFLYFAAQNGPAKNAMDVALAYPPAQHEERFARFRGELLTHLVDEGHAGLAFDYARQVAGANARFLGAAGFAKDTVDPAFAPLTWQLTNGNGIYGELLGGALQVSADPGARGVALQRLFQLKPGSWRLALTSEGLASADELKAEWRFDCLSGAAATPVATLPMAVTSAKSRFAGALAVPANCEAVRLVHSVNNLDEQETAELKLDGLSLERAGG